MKQILFTLIAILFMNMGMQAQTWNGSVSNVWTNPLNWTPNTVPGIGSYVTINVAPNSPKLQGNTTIGGINLSGGSFDFNGFSLTVDGLSNFFYFNNATFTNSNISSDIVLNINTGGGGYNTVFGACTINDKITINLTGSNTFSEGSSATANTYNGDAIFNVNAGYAITMSAASPSQFNGNFNFNRTVAGPSNLFSVGGNVTGNFNYQNTLGGAVSLGYAGANTTINGTCTINANNPSTSAFTMLRLKNLTAGGSVNVQNSIAFNIQNDTLKVSSLTVQGYRGGNYAIFRLNKIDGNVTLADDASYGGGYYTDLRNNLITGNSSFTSNGGNHFYESDALGTGSVYNGNTIYVLNGSGNLYLNQGDKSTYNGNLTITRNSSGYTRAFGSGNIINGNFSYTSTAAGDADFGSSSVSTPISGTVNMNLNLTAVSGISIYRMVNQTPGGKINIRNSRGFDIRNDSLKVDSLNVLWYRGGAYGYFYNNQLNGHLTLSDSTNYGGGYATFLQNNVVTGNSTFNVYGTNTFYEASASSNPNTFNGNVTFNLIGPGSLYTCQQAKSTITGNFTVTRTGAGYTRLFANGAIIGGNFAYSKNAAGASDIGLLASKTSIGGTLNMNVTQTTNDEFSLMRVQNLTNGGSILVQNCKAPNIQQDSLLLTSMSFTGYGGGQYAYLYDNQITGTLNFQDVATYGGGYNTNIQNNTINGSSTFTILGTNTFDEANAANRQNTFNGNVTFNCNGSGSLYTSKNAKSTINGNLTVNRTVAGYTRLFASGATISGNFSYTKNNAGASDLGILSTKTTIGGTINMNVTQTLGHDFSMHRIQNLVNGGSISIMNTNPPNIQQDSLLVTSFSCVGYGTGGYAYFLNNQLTGNLTWSDSASFGSGYNTNIQNNTINGNSIFTILSGNEFNESNSAQPNIFNGNVTYNCNGSGSLYTSKNSKTVYNGNLTVNRTVAGYTSLFGNGATISGNFSYTKNNAGASDLGTTSAKTSIGGTINMNVTQNLGNNFSMYWVKNLTNGGSISVSNTNPPNIQQDSLLVTSFNYNGYGTGGYAYFLNNQLTGNFTWADDPSYGSGYSTTFGNNTIIGNSDISNKSANAYHDGTTANNGNTYLGNVTYNRIGNGAMNIGTVDTNSYAGNFVLNNSSALPINTELIKFIGSTNTNIDQLGTGTVNIQKMIMNKTGAAKVTLNKPVSVTTSCAFLTGYINSTTTNPLIFPDNINHNSASDNSHVIGCVMKAGNDIFTFPLGNGIGYHPLAITAPAAITDSFQACIILKHPSVDGYNVNSKDAALLQIAPYHYWTLNQISGTNSETVSLGWSIPCANTVVASLPGMAVARWNSTLWNNLGNGGTTGTTSLGTVSTAAATSNFGVFALATTNASNSWQITSVTASASTVCAGTSTTLTGAGAATYNWQPGNLSGTSVVVTPLTTTTYTVTGTSSTGCITTATRTITVNPLPNVTVSATATTVCAGVPTTITAVNANTYGWQPGGATTAAITVTPASTTTYTVTGTTTATGCTKTATQLITVNPLPNVTASATATTLCAGASTTITAVNANTYVWQPGGATTAAITVTPASTTTYTVTGTTTATGCTKTATVLITVNPLPNVTASATATTLCAGSPTTITAINANTYVWQPGGATTAAITVSPASTTTYTVTGTTTATGCTKTATRLITVNPLPAVNTSASATTLCAGASTTITGSNANTYVWQPGGLTSNPITVSPAATTTYTVTGTTTATGCTNTATRLITVNPLPNVSTTATSTTICSGASTTITASNANTYVWQPGGLTTNPITVSPTSTTTYTVTGTTTATGCTKTATRLITVNFCNATVNLKLFTQGYYLSPSLMKAVRSIQGVSGTSTQVDSITVELRSATTYTVVASVKAMLNTNGTATCLFPPITGNYYVAVKHRNTIQTWSATPITVGPVPVTYDFSNAINKAYGNNMLLVSPGVYAFYTADINQDENIDLADYSLLDIGILNFDFGYQAADLNGDGNVDIGDVPLFELNNSNFIFSQHP